MRRLRYTLPITILFVAAIAGGIHITTKRKSPTQILARQHYQPMLSALWADYKQHSWDSTSGRTIDRQNNDATTSEGQSYTMLRSVWMNDRHAFDKTWQWSQNNLQRKDKLFSWHWGKRTDSSWGIMDRGGNNTASDADSDIALSLIMATARWHDATYLAAAKEIIPSIWSNEVAIINGRPYMTADNLEPFAANHRAVINPSYFAPYAYRVFAKLDKTHDWNEVARSSYDILSRASTTTLGTKTSANIPPGWVEIDLRTGQLHVPTSPNLTTDFGYDALRTTWRTGLDVQWFNSNQARKSLAGYTFFQQQWNQNHRLYAIYGHDGTPQVNYESLPLYGSILAYFKLIDHHTAQTILTNKLLPVYDLRNKTIRQPLSYYDNNWIWFGVALYANQLPNLANEVA